MKKISKFILIILLVISFIASSYYFISNYMQEQKEQDTFNEIIEEVTINSDDNTEEEPKIDLYNLYLSNNDLVGWIEIPGTNINYPVMQNEEYYLHRDFNKEYSSLGVPFLAEQCDINTSDNLIIYGHHIRSGLLFADLDKYKASNYYENRKLVNFYKLEGNSTIKETYSIIACFKTTANSVGFKYYNFYKAESEAEYNSFVEKCKELSFYNIEDTASYGDRLITLSTCEYSLNNGRMVIVAMRNKK